jgi:hypothetical protein
MEGSCVHYYAISEEKWAGVPGPDLFKGRGKVFLLKYLGRKGGTEGRYRYLS